jgi:quercetin dioxygenase-like cupin family protein|tara:strand:- start:847 stop:1173 length:327 start_codon:yes stop_codon:yes gene_type:complete
LTYTYDPKDMASRELAPGVNLRTMSGEKMMLSVVEISANAVMPPHSHPHEQAGMVLEGEFEFTIGEETSTVKKGDVYIIPGGVEHSLRANGEPSLALDIFSPPREDYM